eukprot:5074496-Alexandrium_andersonii.AAC.1
MDRIRSQRFGLRPASGSDHNYPRDGSRDSDHVDAAARARGKRARNGRERAGARKRRLRA